MIFRFARRGRKCWVDDRWLQESFSSVLLNWMPTVLCADGNGYLTRCKVLVLGRVRTQQQCLVSIVNFLCTFFEKRISHAWSTK